MSMLVQSRLLLLLLLPQPVHGLHGSLLPSWTYPKPLRFTLGLGFWGHAALLLADHAVVNSLHGSAPMVTNQDKKRCIGCICVNYKSSSVCTCS
jgi:hypothetical protein